MLSLKRLFYVLFIVCSICGIFITYSLNENRDTVASIRNPVIEDEELVHGKSMPASETPYFYVVGSQKKADCKEIYHNVCQLMDDLKVSFCKKDAIGEAELKNERAVIVFCDDVVNSYVDLPLLAQFIEKGGKVIMAAGVAEQYEDAYLMPVFGISEKTIKKTCQMFHFEKPFFVLQETDMAYDGDNASVCLKLRKDASVYVKDGKDQIPVVYTYPYGKGETLVLNATLLKDSRCMGFLAAGISILLGEFIYPVLGTECIYLDHFPMVTYANDQVCMKNYGRTTEAFVRDVVWPVFQGMAVRNEVRYTSSVLCVSGGKKAFPAISESLFHTMGKSALCYSGELAYASDYSGTAPLYRNNEFIRAFDDTYENYQMSSLVMMSGQSVRESVDALPMEIRMVRGKLDAKKDKERMAVLKDYSVFPEATRGMELEGGNMLAVASVLTSHGMVSHTFDMNQLISVEETAPGWEENKVQLEAFEKKIMQKTDYLWKVTLSETKNRLKSYEKLKYTWKRKGSSLIIYADQFVAGQPFLLRTDGSVSKSSGAEYEEIGNHYYLLRMNSEKAVLTIKKGEE